MENVTHRLCGRCSGVSVCEYGVCACVCVCALVPVCTFNCMNV